MKELKIDVMGCIYKVLVGKADEIHIDKENMGECRTWGKKIYVPAYKWVLENKCADLVNKIRIIAQHKTVILLDYNTNEDIERASKPLSHASILKRYIEDTLV